MAEYELVDPRDPVLNETAQTIDMGELESEQIQRLIDAMLAMAAGKGHDKSDTRQLLGLAAPQIGVSKAIIMIDLATRGMNEPQDLRIYVNPRIVHRSEETVPGREGCWSTGNICGNVERAREVTMEALDRYGAPVTVTYEGFTARLAQHETDHLAGIRFPDRIMDDSRLHWVEHSEFDDYRVNWANWTHLCPRSRWEALKAGE